MACKKRNCIVEGCEKNVLAREYCDKHYRKFMLYGNATATKFHNMSRTPEYSVWASMISRCTNSKKKYYHRYGGRGITVCDRWKNSFVAFFEDLGAKPFLKAQIDRIDNDGNYEPNNCRWVTPQQNSLNSNLTKIKTHDTKIIKKLHDQGKTIKFISKKYNVSESTVRRHLNKEGMKNE